jgi:hypothetical protein
VGEPEHGERADDEPAASPAPAPPEPALPDSLRRRLDEVFGDVLPDATRDEQRDAADEPPAAADEWLRANRPPHHGG